MVRGVPRGHASSLRVRNRYGRLFVGAGFHGDVSMGPDSTKVEDYAEHLIDSMDERVDERALPEISDLFGQQVNSIDEAYDLAADSEDVRQIDDICRCAAYDIAEEDLAEAAEFAAEMRYYERYGF